MMEYNIKRHNISYTAIIVIVLISLNACNVKKTIESKEVFRHIANSDNQWTGLAVNKKKRVFVNFPYWSDYVPISVGEIIDGEVVPFPDTNWNNRSYRESFHAVQSVVIDAEDRLWVVDTKNPMFKGVEEGGPVVYMFNLDDNVKEEEFHFPENTYKKDSYFNDIRVDVDKEVAYITDSGSGAIVVLDLKTRKARRLLSDNPSVKSETDHLICDSIRWNNSVNSDGIALSPDGSYLYYIALTAHSLYRIPTNALLNESYTEYDLSQQVERVGSVPATDGMLFDNDGNLWMGGLENNAINMLDTNNRLYQVFQDTAIRWADSFAKDRFGNIYFSTSQIYLPEKDRGDYSLFSFNPKQVEGMKPIDKILIAVTSHSVMGKNKGAPTGYYLSEVSHAYYKFREAGYLIDFVSPKGGMPPVTGLDVEDSENDMFLNDPEAQSAIRNSYASADVQPEDYIAIYYAGGHGVMWDFPDDKNLQNISREIYEDGGVVAAVCHGSAGLINIKLSDGKYLIQGKNISTFTNQEEEAVKLDTVVPFPLESMLREHGARIQKTDNFQQMVTVDKRVITGQNPASAKAVADSVIMEIIKK